MFQYINKFSKEQIRQFEKSIMSPFHNTNRYMVKMFKFLVANYPNISNQDPDKKTLFRKIYRTGKYDDVKMRRIFSDFYKLTDKFLLQEAIEKNELQNLVLIAKSNLKYGMIPNYKKKIDHFQKIIKGNKYLDEEENLAIYKFYLDYFRFNFGVLRIKDFKHLQKCNSYMNNNFILMQLTTFITYLSYKYSHDDNSIISFEFIDPIIMYVEKNLDKIKTSLPLIYVRFLIIKMCENFDPGYFRSLTNYFNSNKKIFKGDMLKEYYQSIALFFSYNLNKTNDETTNYEMELFKLTDFLIKNGHNDIILYDGHITQQAYLTAIVNSLKIREYEWARSFMLEYKKYLFKDSASNTYNYAQVIYNYRIRNFDKMLYYLNRINNKFPYYFFHSKIHLIRYHFEMNNSVQLDYEIKNLNAYCNTNKEINENEKKLIKTFIKHIIILQKYESTNKKKNKLYLDNFKADLDIMQHGSIVSKKQRDFGTVILPVRVSYYQCL